MIASKKLPSLRAAAAPLLALSITLSAGMGLSLFAPASEAHAQGVVTIGSSAASQRIKLGLNKSIVIDLPRDAYDILVANPGVADAVTRTARRIYLFGKQVGETNIFVFGPNGEQIASLDLRVERDVAGLEEYLKRFLLNSDIKAELINDNVVLTGTVDTPLDAKRATDLASIFVSGGEATTGQYSMTAAGGSSASGVSINNPDGSRRGSSIVNMLQIVGEDQVTLKVTVAEVSRSVMKQLGVNMVAQTEGFRFDMLDPTQLVRAGTGLGGADLLQGYINAMEQSGVMRTLAEPTLTAVSGEKATFRAGGEYNVVAGEEENNNGLFVTTIRQIEYGIGLEFQPVVLSPGRISLKVRTSVSEPTTEGAEQVASGRNILSLRRRMADTTVELPSGGSMMIAGLVSDNVRQNYNRIPGLSKIPVLGTLFRSRDFNRSETELVIIVTPYISKPTARTALAKPDDNFTPASDGAGIFLGRVNRVYGTMNTDRPAGRYHGVVGFIYK
ncbi:type II and III secretion system protein family protein [Mesorhizobium microcysteis]|uniref:Type II and III secretion system protein family protein n=1 Tax=Neoaquamicrobium microcysteis TaxID=2682781 RepID=A0A5D4GQZ2_9HYPH|nr:type II and III secretion system protein family protein [Mesorhizobium microcysteis]TYR29745.1 type II and III secretion system protein family protein [Mesorhizobium microcysteis]